MSMTRMDGATVAAAPITSNAADQGSSASAAWAAPPLSVTTMANILTKTPKVPMSR